MPDSLVLLPIATDLTPPFLLGKSSRVPLTNYCSECRSWKHGIIDTMSCNSGKIDSEVDPWYSQSVKMQTRDEVACPL